MPLVKKFGAAVIFGTIDEDKREAMAVTAEKKLAVARRARDYLVKKWDFNEGDIIFESLEDDPQIGLDPEDIREEYQKAVQRQIESYRALSLGLGVDYVFLETTTPLDQALSYYLLKRQSMTKV